MKQLCVQIQPEREPCLDKRAVVRLFEELRRDSPHLLEMCVDEGRGAHPYININCTTDNPGSLWAQVKRRVYEESDPGSALARASVVVCEGDAGWDDYLLLHHHDENEKLDSL